MEIDEQLKLINKQERKRHKKIYGKGLKKIHKRGFRFIILIIVSKENGKIKKKTSM